MTEETMSIDEVNQGFAVALSKEFGPGVMVELIEHALEDPPKEPRVLLVPGDSKAPCVLHPRGESVCATTRIRGTCYRCGCGLAIWDDRI